MVSGLKTVGRQRDARRLFEKLLGLRNDVGLLSEEFDVNRNRMVGNFPQAFSHIALVNARILSGGGTAGAQAQLNLLASLALRLRLFDEGVVRTSCERGIL